MKTIRKRSPIAVILAMTVSLLYQGPDAVRADDSDIFGANIEPNVMILIDSSGSMGSSIPSVSYASATKYSGSYSEKSVYRRTSSGYSLYASKVTDVPDSNAQSALNTYGFWAGQIGGSNFNLYLGNYLNYLNCTTCTGTQEKIVIAKEVVTTLVNVVQGVRFGVMKFSGNGSKGQGGAGMVAEIGTAKSTIITEVNKITDSGYTPTGEQLRDAGKYYSGTFGSYASPIQVECQPNFVIIISDGQQNGTINVVNQAKTEYDADHSSFAGTQNVIVHTVGFDISSNKVANDDLIAAAKAGGGQFFAANNSGELALALQDAIRLIIESVFTFAAPLVPTTSATGSTRAYIASFQSDASKAFWRGFLKAYARDSNGELRLLPDSTPDPTYLDWEAGSLLNSKAAANRVIYKENKSEKKLEAFDKTKVTAGSLGVVDNGTRDNIVDYIRGIDVFDEDGDNNTTEERVWKLGDIFHSTPVLVSPPLLPITDPEYVAFKKNNATRTSVLLAGSNDGMLHAFRESDGVELWAYIPGSVMGNLQYLGGFDVHRFYVDSSPIVMDIKVKEGSSMVWKTIAVFGLRRGGKSYHALDITDTTAPKYMWSFTDTEMGETWSEPAMGKIKWDGADKYVAFMGGGYNTEQNNALGRAFYIVDLETGTKLYEYYNDGTLDDRQYMNFSLAANPVAADLNADGYVDRVYIADVGGQVWRFEPEGASGSSAAATLYNYKFLDKDSVLMSRDFTKKLEAGVTTLDLKLATDVVGASPPDIDDCPVDCYAYNPAGGAPEAIPESERATKLGYVGNFNSLVYGSGHQLTSMTYVSESGGTVSASTTWKGKRLFAAAPSQANPPAAGEFYPAQGIYSAPALAQDTSGNLWLYFGTGDRNHPRNSSSNRFYGIKDNTSITNGNTLDESDLLKVLSTTTAVSASVQGWYFVLATDEKVLAAADVFNGIVFFTTFTISDSSLCGAGGGTAKLYAVQTVTGFAAMDFSSGDALTSTDGSATKATIIGTGIPSKPQVVIDASGNPSVITGTTSQQVSSVPAPPISTNQLLGWREVF